MLTKNQYCGKEIMHRYVEGVHVSSSCFDGTMPQPPEPLTAARDLSFLNPSVLERLKKYDLNGRLLSQEPFAVGYGSFSDVFKGECRYGQEGSIVMAAMKRLRLHVGDVASKHASLLSFLSSASSSPS